MDMDHKNMDHDHQNWPAISLLTGLFTALYNFFARSFEGLSTLTLNDWLGVLGVAGMLFSLMMQRHYNRKREAREQEKHEWERVRQNRAREPPDA